ncbi:MAG: tetraacyldisaccharide 4'-kinase [Deltaproteobacteria bacterium]|nr:tetraacyldisaccharide 4'-kinase [Deltaproteobacteria bacterium]
MKGVPHIKRPDWSRIHRDTSFRAYTPILALLSLIYSGGIHLRHQAYRHQLMKGQALPGLVVSVGNLTVGGTGKTPAIITLAQWAVRQGYRTAILSRGYGGKRQKIPLAVSDGSDTGVTGDEPYLLANALPGVPVVVFEKRYQAGLYAKERFGTDLFLLDDGFQHLELKRDMDIVLVDAVRPFGNGHLLPWGPLREPVDGLRRADAIVLTRYEDGDAAEGTAASLKRRFPSTPLFYANHRPREVVFANRSGTRSPACLKLIRVAAFAGIAHPDVFRKTLEHIGAHVAAFRQFSDHHRYTRRDIESLDRMKTDAGASLLLTTEKDWVRIAKMVPADVDIAYLTIEFSFLPNSDGFFRMLRDGLKA